MIDSTCVSAFDLDQTLFKDNSSFRFGLFLYKNNHISLNSLIFILWSNLTFSLGLISIRQLHKNAFKRLFLGKSASVVKQWAQDFLDVYFESLIYLPAVEKLKQAKSAGHITVILSSSPEFLVEPIAHLFGVSSWRATQYAVDKDQRFCHIAQLMLGEDKAQFIGDILIKKQALKKDIIAYSDSYLDLPFLLAAGNAVGVNPDRKLRSICKNNNWPII